MIGLGPERESMERCTRGVGLAVLMSVGLLVGCRGQTPEQRVEEAAGLKTLAISYGQFFGENRGRPPANEQVFKRFIEQRHPEALQQPGVESVDDLFISPRDKKPYQVFYGRLPQQPGYQGHDIVAYEQEGTGGTRMVATSMGAVFTLTEEEFRQALPDAL